MGRLATVSLAFSAAVFAANYILPASWLAPCACLAAVMGLGLAALRRKWLRGLILALAAFAVGLGCFCLHVRRTTVPAQALEGQEREVTARILEYPETYEEYCRARVLLTGEGLPRLEALVYNGDLTMADRKPGQTVRFRAKVSAADKRYGEKYDAYNARDIYLILNTRSSVELSREGFVLSALPVKMNRAASELIGRCFPQDTAAFMQALLLGDKRALYEDDALYLHLSQAGLMHVVAVSGMHIAFLVNFLQLLLGKTGKSSLLCMVLVWLFVLLTGAPPSAVRAGIMQSFLLTAPLVDRENDPLTSLSFALALLLLFNPYAAASVSLQLSFGAMAGICFFSERIGSAVFAALPKRLRRKLFLPVSVLTSSVSVMVFTVPLTALHFGSVSLAAPVTNILCFFAVSLCFCGGAAACVLAAVLFPLGIAAAWVVSWPARYLLLVARLISSVPYAVVYTDNRFVVWWLALCYGLFLLASLSRLPVWVRFALPAALSLAVLAADLAVVRGEYSSGKGVISVLDVGQGQCICVFSGDQTMMIDCGGLGTADNAGETAGAYLKGRGRKRVDTLLLTHLHADHANGAAMLLEMVDVSCILMPVHPNDDDGLLEELLESAERHGTQVRYIGEDETLRLGGIEAELYAPGDRGDTNERCVMTKVSVDGYDMLITADSAKSAERELIADHAISGVELLIAGHHGSRYACCGELLGSIGASAAVVSVGYNTYGHPTYETLERLTAYGYTVYRTDLNGTVEFRIG